MNLAEAIASVDRRQFLPADAANADVEDIPIWFAPGQTVPTARMTQFFAELAKLKSTDIVLEIGTGSGYQAAILAALVKEVHTLEVRDIAPGLSEKLPANVTIYHRDGVHDLPEGLVADAILVTCAVPGPYRVWKKVLRDGGVIVLPKRNGEICKYVREGPYLRDMGPYAYANFVDVDSPVSELGLVGEDGL